MFGMANPEAPDFGGGWLPLAVLLMAALLLAVVKLNTQADSKGDKS